MGKLEVICGPMFSGKSEELLRRLKRAKIGGRPFLLCKPSLDNRYSRTSVVTHSGNYMPCVVVKTSDELLATATDTDCNIIAIDECQFLDEDTPKVIEWLVSRGKRVIVAGLDMDYNGVPFSPMPQLLAMAESVLKVTAVCNVCGDEATHTYRHSGKTESSVGSPAVLVGATDHYEARCRKHWKNDL